METWIKYASSDVVFRNYVPLLEGFITANNAKSILEVGGGANPSFTREQVEANSWTYTLLDVAAGELAKAPAGYKKVVSDIGKPIEDPGERFDFIFSKMLMEHVEDAEVMHENIYALLAPGGVAFHFFPTLFAPPYVANLLMPERLSELILWLAHPERNSKGNAGKFPAHYSWCFGPTKRQVRQYEQIGYTVLCYVGLFGHSYYYEKIPGIRKIHEKIVSYLLTHPNPYLTSYAYVVLRKS